MTALLVRTPGPLATVQDLGRAGWTDAGVSPSGAADLDSHQLANRLVGNHREAATIEVTYGGLSMIASGDVLVAVTGPPVAVVVAGRDVGTMEVIRLHDRQELRLARPGRGVRNHVAVRGGVDVAPVLGSRSTDILSGLGPPRLEGGMRLGVGGAVDGPVPAVDVVPWCAPPRHLRVHRGPRDDWLSVEGRSSLMGSTWTVAADGDRVGLRLDGPTVARLDRGELPSEGVVRGAVQVPPDGRPIVFLADHPITGGYPTVAVVTSEDLRHLAQLAAGDELRFRAHPAATSGATG